MKLFLNEALRPIKFSIIRFAPLSARNTLRMRICTDPILALRSASHRLNLYKKKVNVLDVRTGSSPFHLGGKRTFLDLRNLIGGNSSDVERFNESVVLNYSCKELYTIVSDVNSYSKFVPFCVESRILGKTSKPSPASKQEQATSVVDAELAIGFAALRETYVSEVSMRPDEFVKVRVLLTFRLVPNLLHYLTN